MLGMLVGGMVSEFVYRKLENYIGVTHRRMVIRTDEYKTYITFLQPLDKWIIHHKLAT